MPSTRKRMSSSGCGVDAPTMLLRTMWRGSSGGVGTVLVGVVAVTVLALAVAVLLALRGVGPPSSVPAEAIAPTVAPTASRPSTIAVSLKLSLRGGGGGGGGGGRPCGGGAGGGGGGGSWP